MARTSRITEDDIYFDGFIDINEFIVLDEDCYPIGWLQNDPNWDDE